MKAARFYGSGRPLQIEEVPVPSVGAGELLVRVAACGVCHTDLHYLDHNVPTFRKPPIILGHEASGRVERLGPGVEGFAPGDAVIVPAVISCGDCARCREGRSNLCERMEMYGNHRDGGFAEFVVCPAREAVRLPAEIPLEEACVIGDAVTTAYHAVVNRGGVGTGQQVAVFGCGGVGINVLQMAAARGADVIAVDAKPEKLEVARSMGAKTALPAEPGKSLAREIRKATGGGVDVAFECIGNPNVIREAHESVRRGGRLVLVGFSDRPAELAVGKIMFLEQEVRGSLGCPPGEIPKVLRMILDGKIRIRPLVTGRYPLERIHDALDALRRGEGLRNIVIPGSDSGGGH